MGEYNICIEFNKRFGVERLQKYRKFYDGCKLFLVRHEMSTLGMGYLEEGGELNAQGSLKAHRIGLGPLNKDLQSV